MDGELLTDYLSAWANDIDKSVSYPDHEDDISALRSARDTILNQRAVIAALDGP